MLDQNKMHRNLMEEKDKDIDDKLIFNPQIGLGHILFSFNEDDVLKILGVPMERNIDMSNDNEYTIYLDYCNLDIFVFLHFENNKLDYLSMHTKDIILAGFHFSLYDPNEILSFVKEYHNVQKLDFIENMEYDEDMEESCYSYKNIGLTIWFDKSGISGICVRKTV